MKKKISDILSWVINGLLTGGLITFGVIFFMRGDTFHAVLDLLYLFIILSNFIYRHEHKKMKKERDTAFDASKELILQNEKLTEKLRDINDPFMNNREIYVAKTLVKMCVINSQIKYNKKEVIECSNDEREKRYKEIERQARAKLLKDIIETELITIGHTTNFEGERVCTAEIIVGVKGNKNINEIINS